jgi:electron transfer flavoprotein alpha subunit
VNSYFVITEPRQRWAYAVVCGGRTYARCDSFKDAMNVAKAMNIAMAASRAAALETTKGDVSGN